MSVFLAKKSDQAPEAGWTHYKKATYGADPWASCLIFRPEDDLLSMTHEVRSHPESLPIRDLALLIREGRRPDLTLLQDWPRLKTLTIKLAGAPVSLDGLSQHPTLEHVHLDLEESSEIDLTFLNTIRSLQKVKLVGNHTRQLKRLPPKLPIRSLELDFTKGTEFSPIAAQKNLEELVIRGQLDPFDVSFVQDLSELKELDLKTSSPQGFKAMDRMPYLQKLNPGDTDELASLVNFKELAGLQELILSPGRDEHSMSELPPLSPLRSLSSLYIDMENLHHVESLAGMDRLSFLRLPTTFSFDLTPLRAIQGLKTLSISDPPQDLSRLKPLDLLQTLRFESFKDLSLKDMAILENTILPDVTIEYGKEGTELELPYLSLFRSFFYPF